MNGKATKMIRELSELTGTDYKAMKRRFQTKSHAQKGAIRNSMPQVREMSAEAAAKVLKTMEVKPHANVSA